MGSEKRLIELLVYRFDPSKDKAPYYIRYKVPFNRRMTVLDALIYILEEIDPSLSFRYNCRSKICGSCAMMINGVQRLACETQVALLGSKIKVEPLAHFKVIKDLVVDMDPFLKKMEAVMPYLFEKREVPRISPEEVKKYDSPSSCIWCGACVSACPVSATNPYFLGPAAFSQLYRFFFDSRETDDVKLLRLLLADSELSGIWRCHQIYACAKVCPKYIRPGDHIAEIKRRIFRARLSGKI